MKIHLISVLIILCYCCSSFAQVEDPCAEDKRKFCTDKNPPEIQSCLLEQVKNLSTICKEQVDRVSALRRSTGARGGGGLSSFGGVSGNFGLMPSKQTVLSMGGVFAPENDPSDISQKRVSLATPVWSNEKHSTSLSVGAGRIDFNSKQLFDGTTIETPEHLDRVEIGGQYSQNLGDKMWGGRLSVGSASNEVFHSFDEMILNANLFYMPTVGPGDQWIYTLFISNNNPIANYVPIPGVIYLHKRERFTGLFGIPFSSIQWTPVDPWTLSVSIMIINFNAEISYGHRDQMQTFVGFSSAQQSFLRAERIENEDRLFFSEKRAFIGVRSPITPKLSGDIQFGDSFDRRLSEGDSLRDRKREVGMGRSWFVGMNLNYLF
jgi:hypothetical protein